MTKVSWHLATVLVAVFCIPAAVSAADWYAVSSAGGLTAETAVTESAPLVSVTASDLELLRVTAASAGLSLETVQNDQGQFVRLSWPDAAPFGEVGTPALPVVRHLFIAPYGAEISWQVNAGQAVVAGVSGSAADSESSGCCGPRGLPDRPTGLCVGRGPARGARTR